MSVRENKTVSISGPMITLGLLRKFVEKTSDVIDNRVLTIDVQHSGTDTGSTVYTISVGNTTVSS